MVIRIGLYNWEILLVDKNTLEGNDGICKPNEFQILVRDDLNETATQLIIMHEVVHALLDTQGRCYQKDFNLEEVCEFVAWKLPELMEINERIKGLR